MSNIYIGKGDLQQLRKFSPPIEHGESKLYVDDENDKLYKILLFELLGTREPIVEFLKGYYNSFCSLPIDKIYDLYGMTFMGYTQDYYSTHLPGSEFIKEDIPFYKLLDLAYLISRVVEDFRHDEIVYTDLHIDNILISPTNIEHFKIIDMDSILLREHFKTESEFKKEIMFVHELLSQTILSIILKIDLQDILAKNENMNRLLIEAFTPIAKTKRIKSFIDSTFLAPTRLNMPSEIIDSIKEENINEDIKNILKLSKWIFDNNLFVC